MTAAEKTHWNYHHTINALRDADSNAPDLI